MCDWYQFNKKFVNGFVLVKDSDYIILVFMLDWKKGFFKNISFTQFCFYFVLFQLPEYDENKPVLHPEIILIAKRLIQEFDKLEVKEQGSVFMFYVVTFVFVWKRKQISHIAVWESNN